MEKNQIIILIGCLILFLFLGYCLICHLIGTSVLKKNYQNSNVLTFGKIGRGKDLLQQYVIYKRKKAYYSNIDYGGKYKHIELKDISVSPNTYDNLINGDVVK